MIRSCAQWCLAVTTLAHRSAQAPAPQPPTPPALVLGRVIDDVSKAPLDDAAVVARMGSTVVDEVRTNSDGLFIVSVPHTGDVSIGAVRPGYQGSGSGQRSVTLRVTSGQHVRDVIVPLRRFLAIGGTVTDEAGEPAVDLAVRLQFKGARGRWSESLTVRTDDRGQYRFAQLTPGRYRVLVMPAEAAVPHAAGTAARIYPMTFAPSARAAAEAAVVALEPGGARDGVDIQLAPVAQAQIAGRLTAPDPAVVAGVPVRLVLADAGGLTTELTAATATADATGRFRFPRVPAGEYRLLVYQPPRPAAPSRSAADVSTSSETLRLAGGPAAAPGAAPAGPTWWAETAVSVGERDVDDLDVPLRSGFRVSGQTRFDGTSEKPTPTQLAAQIVQLIRVDAPAPPFVNGRLAADGTFLSPEVRPGKYILQMGSGPGGWRLRAADYRGVNIADAPVEIHEALAGVTLIFTDRQPSVSGMARDAAGQPASGAAAVIFPKDRRLWDVAGTSWRMKLARANTTGEFTIRDLPAGDYLCAAIGDELVTNWNDVETLSRLEALAAPVTLVEGQPARQDVTLVVRLAKTAVDDGWADATAPHGPFVPDGGSDAGDDRARHAGVLQGEVSTSSDPAVALRGVGVELRAQDGAVRDSAFTDAHGRFAFSGVAPGVYRLFFTKPAYLAAEYGAKRPGGPGTAVTIGDAPATVAMRLTRGAVITGRVVDTHGRPLNWTKVAIVTARSGRGQALAGVPSAMPRIIETDDRGEYRIFGLPPGTYFVAATPGGGGGAFSGRPTTDADIARMRGEGATPAVARPSAQAFAPTFFPAAQSFAAAQPITVAAGEERRGVDIAMALAPVAHIRGTIAAADGAPAPGTQLAIFPAAPYVPDGDVLLTSSSGGEATSLGGAVRVNAGVNGAFNVGGLNPGRYVVFARGGERGAQFAVVNVTIDDADPAPLAMTLRAATRITGRLVMAQGTGGDLSHARVGLQPADAGSLSVTIPPQPVSPDGRFELVGAIPGEYWVTVTGLPPSTAVIAGLGEGSGARRAPLLVPDQTDEVSLALTVGQAASLSGTFTDVTGAAATDYFVIAFDPDRAVWRRGSPRLQAVRPDTEGHFMFGDLPPGQYRLAAVTDIDEDGWSDPVLLEQLLPASVDVTVSAGRDTVQNLRAAKTPPAAGVEPVRRRIM